MLTKNRLAHMAILICAAVVFTLFSCSTAIPSQQQDIPVPFDTHITSETLPNGLTWYFRHNSEPENRASLRLYVKAGSLMEDDDQAGIAHLVEHMAFNGTENFSKQEIVGYLESIGMQFGPEVNASTGFDRTTYKIDIPTDDEQIIRTAFRILADWAHSVNFDEAELKKERSVVYEEWRQGLGADRRMLDQWLPFLLQDSLYAKRLPIGKMDVVMNTPSQRVRDFYTSWYRPERMAVVAVGDLDETLVKQIIEEYFGFTTDTPSPQEPDRSAPSASGVRVKILSDPELTESRVSLYTAGETPLQTSVSDYRDMLIDSLYWSLYNSRLEALQRQPDPPFLRAAGYRSSIDSQKHFLTLGASGKCSDIGKATETLLVEERKVRTHGYSSSEIQAKKTEILNHYKKAYEERGNRRSDSIAAEIGRHFLEGEAVPGIEWEYEFARKTYSGLTSEELAAYPGNVGGSDDLAVIVMTPEGSCDITGERILSAIDNARRAAIEPYEETDIPDRLMETPPRPGTYETVSYSEDTGVTLMRLSNGIRVAVKNTDFQNNRIHFSAFSHGGSSLVDDEDFIAINTAETIRRYSGLGRFDDLELKRYMDTKDLSLSVSITEFFEGFTGESSTGDFPAMLEMVHLLFTSPRFTQKGFDTAKSRILASIENQENDPNHHFTNTLRELVLGDSIRYRALTAQSVEQMNLEKSARLYRDRFADARDFTFVFTGNTEAIDLPAIVSTYLGSLPVLEREEKGRDLGIRPSRTTVYRKIETGLENKADVALFFIRDMPWSRETALVADSAARILDVILREKIREDLSGTYSIGVQSVITNRPWPYSRLAIYFGCDPARADELTQEIFAVLHTVSTQGPDPELVANQREQYRRSYETAMRSNPFWLSHITETLREDMPLGVPVPPESHEKLITAESVRSILSAMTAGGEYIRVDLLPGPESRNEKPE